MRDYRAANTSLKCSAFLSFLTTGDPSYASACSRHVCLSRDTEAIGNGISRARFWPNHLEVLMRQATQAWPSPQGVRKIGAMDDLKPLRRPHNLSQVVFVSHEVVCNAKHRSDLSVVTYSFDQG
jgi:hypothetical protein